jgi:hypothetical protein
MSEKRKSTLLSAIQGKNRRAIISTEEKLDVIKKKKKVNELLTYGVMLDSLIEAYEQYVILLIHLQKVLSQDLKCLCSKSSAVLSERTVRKTMHVSLFQFYCIRNYIYMYIYIYI